MRESLILLTWIWIWFRLSTGCIPVTPIDPETCPSSIYVADCGGVDGGTQCKTTIQAAVSITSDLANDRCVLSFSCPDGTESYIWMFGSTANPFLYSGTNLVYAPDDKAGLWYLASGLRIFQLTCMNLYACISHLYADDCGEVPNYSFLTCPTTSEAGTAVTKEETQCRQTWSCPGESETYVWILDGSTNPISWSDSYASFIM